MSKQMRTLLAGLIFLSGLATFIFALLALTGKITGIWPAGLAFVIYLGLTMVYSRFTGKIP